MVDEESLQRNRNATPQFIGALTDMVWHQIGRYLLSFMLTEAHELTQYRAENVATDLESFSRHAGRTTVTTDDVLLLARRNSDLYSVIKDAIDKAKAAKAKEKGKGRARG
jgi:hypothetical protein